MPWVFNPFTGTLDYYKSYISYIGGLYGVNTETLTGNKTLTPGVDKIYQYLDEGDANRVITLETVGAIEGDQFLIRHNGIATDTHYLQVKQAAIILDQIYVGAIKHFIFDGTNWIPLTNATGENDNKKLNVIIGYFAQANSMGTAIGAITDAHNYGLALGYNAVGYTYGAAIGVSAQGETSGVSIGYGTKGSSYSVAIGAFASRGTMQRCIALGYQSTCARYGELSWSIDGVSNQLNNIVIVGWTKTTVNNTPIVMLCAGQAAKYCTIRPSSALAFKITVTARDNVAGHVAMYTFEGLIKRDAANNTILSVVNKTVIFEDDATWDANVTADDVNECLTITVTGDDTNPTQWAARLDGVETHF
jgi:hypothetical protein